MRTHLLMNMRQNRTKIECQIVTYCIQDLYIIAIWSTTRNIQKP